jgi:predicted nucleic-acid-binding protein
MTLGIDTSVLVRVLVGEPAALAAKAQRRLLHAHQEREPVMVSDVVVAEAYHALKYHYALDPTDIRKALTTTLTSGLVQLEPGSAALTVLQSTGNSGAGFVDRLIHARYRLDGVTTLTFDKTQAKLGNTELID